MITGAYLDYITGWTAVHQSDDFVAESVTGHWWGNPDHHRRPGTFDGIARFLASDNERNASAHFVVSGLEGKLACLVDLDHAAWHAGVWAGNHRSVGIECRPIDDKTPAAEVELELAAVAYTVALIWHWRAKLKGATVKGHQDWVPTACPGWYYPHLDEIRDRAVDVYPRVDTDNPGRLLPGRADVVTGDDDMASAADVWTADIIPRPNFNDDTSNENWQARNAFRIGLDLAYQARQAARNAERNSAAGLEIMRELAKVNRPLTAAETEAAAKRGLQSIVADTDVTMTIEGVDQ